MLTERQIANRRNAAKSTGPRSSGGRKRASRNSFRHGLSAQGSWSAKFARAVERLARKIAGRTANPIALELARAAAQGQLEVARIRQLKVAAIQQGLAIEAFKTECFEAKAALQSVDPERMASAVRGALPQLLKLERYQRRAWARRDQALRGLKRI